jgi:cytochrome d ubiquinol oxidase subunit I
VFLVALLGAVLYRRKSLAKHRWFLWTGVVTMFLPFLAAACGWMLTEFGRQPWIVQSLLETSKANSPSVSATWLGISLSGFVLLYLLLLALDIWLMRRYAGIDPLEEAVKAEDGTGPLPERPQPVF